MAFGDEIAFFRISYKKIREDKSGYIHFYLP